MSESNFLKAAFGMGQFPIKVIVLLLFLRMTEQSGKNRKAIGLGHRRAARQVGARGDHVVKNYRLVGFLAGRDMTGPASNERHPSAAFVRTVLLAAQRSAR